MTPAKRDSQLNPSPAFPAARAPAPPPIGEGIFDSVGANREAGANFYLADRVPIDKTSVER
jgi:hypothetical protein